MYSVVVAFGLASVMLCIGMAIRAKVKFFQHMLMPVSVIGGILGFILMNLVLSKYPVGGVSVTDFSNIVDVFFVMSFISIGLTGSKKKKNKKTEDGKKKKILAKYEYDLGACMFCQLCVNACPHDAITFDQNFEHAVFDRTKLVLQLNHAGSKVIEKKKEV